MDVNFLVDYLRLHPENTIYIVDQLWIEFYNQMSNQRGHILLGCPHLFVETVNKTLKNMDTIYNSVKNANCNWIWVALFHKIRMVGLNYYVFVVNQKFLDLEFRYSKEKVNVAEITNDALTFMGLNDKFTREDLLRSYRKLVLKYHPDKGGRIEDFKKLQVYREQLERRFD